MSLSWDPDDASSDEAGWRTRLGAWFSPSPAELAGLAVLLVGALVFSAVLWIQAASRPTSFGAPDGGPTVDDDHDAGSAAGTQQGPDEVGVGMHADGTAAGMAPGVDGDGAAGDGDGDPADDGHGGEHDQVSGHGGGDDGREPPASGAVIVHVTGAVRTTGLVTLPAGARIGDAVLAAGGTSADALVERVNLARVLIDGEHVHVPREGDDPATLPPIGGTSSGAGSGADGPGGVGPDDGGASGGSSPDGTAPVHLNQASAEELTTLPGIGPARAEAIITHREQQGPFATPGDLRAVSGIGEVTFQRLAPLITVE